ncbi:MAG TPA: 2-C-methyl-D-erythritol 2,4-cyclodiphosphate synthase [Deltaproteobacteria bacterium]|nr:2-C-methyl-D-erythritol 2,4-cyclodiphosphate synthase [Deltaproteobacteria bacterium]
MAYRVGIGFDIHRLVEDRTLVLAGVRVPFEKGLLGHSDGDVVVHALCDAILGALARDDIGSRYPDTAEFTRGMNSMLMLEEIAKELGPTHEIINMDINCICEKPRLSPFRDAMVNSLARACRIEPERISVKFRTHEGLGPIGSSEAIAAQAVVLLRELDS